jgi:hypothetical protein
VSRKLHPSQFEVNDVWIVFRLNDTPIQTERDGVFNCIALMDAASCYILGTEMVSAHAVEPSSDESRRLLQQGRSHKRQLPKKLFISKEQVASALSREASLADIEVQTVPENELLVFIGEARECFREQFGRSQ